MVTSFVWIYMGMSIRCTEVIRKMFIPSPLGVKFKMTVWGGAEMRLCEARVIGLVCCVLTVPLPAIRILHSVVSHLLFAKTCIQSRNSFLLSSLGIYSTHLFDMETLVLIIGYHETKPLGRQSGIQFFHLNLTRCFLLRWPFHIW